MKKFLMMFVLMMYSAVSMAQTTLTSPRIVFNTQDLVYVYGTVVNSSQAGWQIMNLSNLPATQCVTSPSTAPAIKAPSMGSLGNFASYSYPTNTTITSVDIYMCSAVNLPMSHGTTRMRPFIRDTQTGQAWYSYGYSITTRPYNWELQPVGPYNIPLNIDSSRAPYLSVVIQSYNDNWGEYQTGFYLYGVSARINLTQTTPSTNIPAVSTATYTPVANPWNNGSIAINFNFPLPSQGEGAIVSVACGNGQFAVVENDPWGYYNTGTRSVNYPLYFLNSKCTSQGRPALTPGQTTQYSVQPSFNGNPYGNITYTNYVYL